MEPADELEPDEEREQEPAPPPRRRGGAGSVLGAAMQGLYEVFYGPPKDEIAIHIEAAGDPPNLDTDGLDDELSDGSRVVGPPLDELKAHGSRPAARRRRVRHRPPPGR